MTVGTFNITTGKMLAMIRQWLIVDTYHQLTLETAMTLALTAEEMKMVLEKPVQPA